MAWPSDQALTEMRLIDERWEQRCLSEKAVVKIIVWQWKGPFRGLPLWEASLISGKNNLDGFTCHRDALLNLSTGSKVNGHPYRGGK